MEQINRLSADLDEYCKSGNAVPVTNENTPRTPSFANSTTINSVSDVSVSLTSPIKGLVRFLLFYFRFC